MPGSRPTCGWSRSCTIRRPGEIVNFHNTGQDYYGFGKIQYTAGSRDVVNVDLSYSRTRFQVPYDSSGGVFLDDHQTDVNDFVNVGWRHQFAT